LPSLPIDLLIPLDASECLIILQMGMKFSNQKCSASVFRVPFSKQDCGYFPAIHGDRKVYWVYGTYVLSFRIQNHISLSQQAGKAPVRSRVGDIWEERQCWRGSWLIGDGPWE